MRKRDWLSAWPASLTSRGGSRHPVGLRIYNFRPEESGSMYSTNPQYFTTRARERARGRARERDTFTERERSAMVI